MLIEKVHRKVADESANAQLKIVSSTIPKLYAMPIEVSADRDEVLRKLIRHGHGRCNIVSTTNSVNDNRSHVSHTGTSETALAC